MQQSNKFANHLKAFSYMLPHMKAESKSFEFECKSEYAVSPGCCLQTEVAIGSLRFRC